MNISSYLTNSTKSFNILFLAAAILLAGCSKDKKGSASGDYYFKFSVNGQSYNFEGNPYATFSQSNGLYLGGFGSFKDMSVGTKNVVSALVGSTTALKTGTYSGLLYPPSGGNSPTVFFSWIDENGKTFGNLYQDNATNIVTITELTNSSVKGTFSGKIYDVLQPGSAAMSFSGEFLVKRVN